MRAYNRKRKPKHTVNSRMVSKYKFINFYICISWFFEYNCKTKKEHMLLKPCDKNFTNRYKYKKLKTS